jgi:asparagine synthase (glutamine-hydrolysing)
VEIGILLSGGLDSAVIAALAQRNSSRPLKAFTIGFEGNFAEDEIEDAAQTASLLGICHHYKRITFEDYLGTIKECIRIVEEPLATTSLIPMYFLCELASRHVKVVLTGQGADEPLGGYFRYKSEFIRSMFPAFAGNAAAALISILNINI